jgi:hypothetical protein
MSSRASGHPARLGRSYSSERQSVTKTEAQLVESIDSVQDLATAPLPSCGRGTAPPNLSVEIQAGTARTAVAAVFEGCAQAYLGEIDGANLSKLHRYFSKASYLA